MGWTLGFVHGDGWSSGLAGGEMVDDISASSLAQSESKGELAGAWEERADAGLLGRVTTV